MISLFPPAIRFSGISFSYNLAYAIFGGLTPIFVGWLLNFNRLAPANYVGVISLAGAAMSLSRCTAVALAKHPGEVCTHLLSLSN